MICGNTARVYAASSDEIKNVTEKCFAKKREAPATPISHDQGLQEKLWYKGLELLRLTVF